MGKLLRGLIAGVVVVATASGAELLADDPLHARIDRLVAAKFGEAKPAPATDDAAFLRRVYLDLAGRIPTAEEARQFLEDKSQEKRKQLVDRLLAAPSYAERMEPLFHVMLMERRGEDDEWRKFLRACFEQNEPWDAIARAMLAPDAENETTRGAAFFFSKRLENYGQNPVDYPGLTRDVGRLFMGVDLQCAECHNHLFVDDYKQLDFKGLFAAYEKLSIDKKMKFPAVSEKALGEKLQFVSVFDPTQRATGPRVPFGQEFPIPAPPPGDKEADKKGKKKEEKNADPTFSPIALIAEEMASPKNDLFSRNIANRLWFAMMGRGLVEPLDMFHSANPPSHPELLELLAGEFAAGGFDIKWLLRELALTETYQRSSRVPEGQPIPAPESYLIANEKRLSAEQLLASALVATGNRQRFLSGEEGKPNEQFADLESRFLKAFANEAREPEIDFSATVKGALFLLNDDKMLDLLRRHDGNLIDRLCKESDPNRVVDELFLSVFSRQPTEEERTAVLEFLSQRPDDREKALGHVAWSMLTSMEFYVNH